MMLISKFDLLINRENIFIGSDWFELGLENIDGRGTDCESDIKIYIE